VSLIANGMTTDAAATQDSLQCRFEMTAPGTLQRLRITLAAAQTPPRTNSYTVRVNGVNQVITCTPISGQLTAQDLVNTFAVVAGDMVEINENIANGAPINVATRATLEFNPQ
jgi:hypothetical protein